jgi:tetratricopeptide (TPR) repeat protein
MKKNLRRAFAKTIYLSTAVLTLTLQSAAQVTLSQQDLVIPTYPVAPADKNPMFFKGESYQGASRVIYPYAMNDVISPERIDKAWKTVTLENEYIKLCVTPEIGGKLYYATDKTDNYNFVYRNNVVRPSNIGMLGAWVSGGIEWCVFHHHRASTFLPVDYSTSENQDGSKTIHIGETEPRHRMRWTVGITVFPGRSYFETEVKIINPTPFTNSFLYWANVAAHTNNDYQVIFPPSVNIATYHAKNNFTHWPVSKEVYNGQDFTEGVDVGWWKNSPGSNSFFAYDLKEDFMGGYDHGKDAGTVHIGDHNIVKGAKLWEWGSGPRGQATEARLTENDGPYVEIMVGAFSDNQPDYSWIKPYEVKTFKQYWFPVRGIGGFKNANLNGAVNLESRDNDQVFLGYYSTSELKRARIVLKDRDKTIFTEETMISPGKPFTKLIRMTHPAELTDLYTEMVNAEDGVMLLSYRPRKAEYPEKLPGIVERPAPPEKIATTEELYLTGKRIEQFYNPSLNPADYYSEALRRDPGDVRSNTAMGSILLKKGDYEGARSFLLRAVKRLTKDYTRPSDCEALYLEGLALKSLGLPDEAADTLYRATWDYQYHSPAYLELARISCTRGDFAKSLDEVSRSLSTNSGCNPAINLKASILRRLGKYEEALAAVSQIHHDDPLDFRAGNEYSLALRALGRDNEAAEELRRLNAAMRDYDQNYLETGIGYLNDGLPGEAEEIMKRFTGKNPVVSYCLGYIRDMEGDRLGAEELFREGSALSTDNVFPFRLETVNVFKLASSINPGDAKPWYYLGNLLYDRQPLKAISCWEKAVSLEPSAAIAWRNLGWGYYHALDDGARAIAAYEKAISLEKNEAEYFTELDALYELSNTPVEKRLKLFEGNNETVKKRDDSFVRQITVLTLGGKPEKAVEYLEGRNFNYREGNSMVREVIIDAHLMLGRKFMAGGDYQKALGEFLKARIPDEEGGSARAGAREIQVGYYTGLAYEALGKMTRARECFRSSASSQADDGNYIRYYQGLSRSKLGGKQEAAMIFRSMVAKADSLLSASANDAPDFFAKFGEKEARNVRSSNAWLLKGLGYKGLGDLKAAKEALQKACSLSAGNLYAITELEDLSH